MLWQESRELLSGSQSFDCGLCQLLSALKSFIPLYTALEGSKEHIPAEVFVPTRYLVFTTFENYCDSAFIRDAHMNSESVKHFPSPEAGRE